MPASHPATAARFRMLDGLRFVAALMVMAYHYAGREHPYWGEPVKELFPGASPIAAYGALGVQLFFVISGFVILMSAEGRTIGAFIASRVSRLFPAYWFAVIATSILMLWIAPGQFRTLTLPQILLNLTMVQEGLGVESIDGVYWTLWVELLFYVLIALYIVAGISERRILTLVFLWPLAGGVAQASGAQWLADVLLAQYSPFFATGMLIYVIHSRGHNLLRWLLLTFTVCLAVYQSVTYFVMGPMADSTQRELSPVVGTVIVLVLIALVILVTLTPLATRGPRWLVFAGALTYPVYLLHENWGWWVILWAHPILGDWATLILAAAVVIVAAILVERFVERTLRPVLSARIRSSFEHSTAPARVL